jgi:hypothetical protein
MLTDGTGMVLAGQVGRVLAANERVETLANSQAILGLGTDTRIRLGPTSSVRVTGVDENGVQLELEDGALQATVRAESGSVRIASEGREVLATNADFTVGVHGDVLQVGSERGSVSLSGVDVTLVNEGNLAVVVDRHAEIGPVPDNLLLDIEWPGAQVTRNKVGYLLGNTSPGATVQVEGDFGELWERADAEGRFEMEIPLGEGANDVRVRAVDIFGNEDSVTGALADRDSKIPPVRVGVGFGED